MHKAECKCHPEQNTDNKMLNISPFQQHHVKKKKEAAVEKKWEHMLETFRSDLPYFK